MPISVEEGAFLNAQGVDPYSGDLYHNSPLVLWLTSFLIHNIPKWIPLLFVTLDLLAGLFLYCTAKSVMKMLLNRQTIEKKSYAKDTDEFLINFRSLDSIPQLVVIAYLFNPYSIMNCIGQTMTVWSNFLLAGFLFAMSRRQIIPAVLFLAVEVQQNLYPITLIVPLVINHALVADNAKTRATFRWTRACLATGIIAVAMASVAYFNFVINHRNWSFVDSSFGFM